MLVLETKRLHYLIDRLEQTYRQKDDLYIKKYINLIYNESMHIKERISLTVLACKRDDKVKIYIQWQQIELTKLLDELERWVQAPLSRIKGVVQNPLLALLDHLKESFAQYFDVHKKVPMAYDRCAALKIGSAREHVLAFLKEKKLNEQLSRIITAYLMLKIPREISPLSWLDYHYLYTLVAELDRLTFQQQDNAMDYEQEMIGLLCTLNFNHPQFLRYCQEKINESLQGMMSEVEKRQKVLDWARLFGELSPIEDLAFDPRRPSVLKSIGQYIEGQRVFFAALDQLERTFSEKKDASGSVQVSFTLVQLLFFIRLMIETGLLITKNKNNIFQFISDHIRTLTKDSLSYHSIQSKNQTPNQAQIKLVKKALLKMLNLIDEKYITN